MKKCVISILLSVFFLVSFSTSDGVKLTHDDNNEVIRKSFTEGIYFLF